MADFKDKLSSHFNEKQKNESEATKEWLAKLKTENEYLDRFDAMAKQIIIPVFETVRDTLLHRNHPAAIVQTRKQETAPLTSYVGLHCSDDISDIHHIQESPKFKLFFNARESKMWRPLLAKKGGDLTHAMCGIEEVTTEKVEEAVLVFLQQHFPK